MSCYVHDTNHSTNCEPSGIPNVLSHIVKNFMVLSLAWRWLFKSKHVALTYAFIISLCWLEYISIKWIYSDVKFRENLSSGKLLRRQTGGQTHRHTRRSWESPFAILRTCVRSKTRSEREFEGRKWENVEWERNN